MANILLKEEIDLCNALDRINSGTCVIFMSPICQPCLIHVLSICQTPRFSFKYSRLTHGLEIDHTEITGYITSPPC